MNILIHICCGPCLTYPLEWLRENGFDVRGYSFNPNIHPYNEFKKRLDTLKVFAEEESLPLDVVEEYGLVSFLRNVVNHETERCDFCYRIRLENAAEQALSAGCDAFTSTLLVSPYQKHDRIRGIAEEIAEDKGIDFFYQDWREGYRRGVQISREKGMYRQRYCGCIYSEAEREGIEI